MKNVSSSIIFLISFVISFLQNSSFYYNLIKSLVVCISILKSKDVEEYNKKKEEYNPLKLLFLPKVFNHYKADDICELLGYADCYDNPLKTPLIKMINKYKKNNGEIPKYYEKENGISGMYFSIIYSSNADTDEESYHEESDHHQPYLLLFTKSKEEKKNSMSKTGYKIKDDVLYINEIILAHEFAHYYIGDMLTWAALHKYRIMMLHPKLFEYMHNVDELIAQCFEIFVLEKTYRNLKKKKEEYVVDNYIRISTFKWNPLHLLNYGKARKHNISYKYWMKYFVSASKFKGCFANELMVLYPLVKFVLNKEFEKGYKEFAALYSDVFDPKVSTANELPVKMLEFAV